MAVVAFSTLKMMEENYMRTAIEKVKEGIAKGQTPFGSLVEKQGEVIAVAHNTVWDTTDPTAHAEVNAIRLAAKTLGTINLAGCNLYTTCEPCPMCLTAIHWAHFDKVYFGATIADAEAAGFSELTIPAKEMVKQGGSPLIVEDGILREECAELFQIWQNSGMNKTY